MYARNPDEAMDLFIKRELPEILDIKNGSSHNVLFIPDTYIYNGITEKVSKKLSLILLSLFETNGNMNMTNTGSWVCDDYIS